METYQSSKVVLEATRNWGLIYGLREILDDVALAHPLRVRAIAKAMIKTIEAYVSSKET